MHTDMELPERIRQNYRPADASSGPAPIEVMGRIYERFGQGGVLPDEGALAARDDLVDIGIGSYLTVDPGVLQATIDGLAAGTTHYSRLAPVNPISQAVARKYLDEQSIDLDAGRQVYLMGGARVGMTLALLRVLNPGERVVIPDPDYIGLNHVARGLGAKIVRVPMRRDAAGAFSVNIEEMVWAIGEGC